jgi:hypothetical protein
MGLNLKPDTNPTDNPSAELENLSQMLNSGKIHPAVFEAHTKTQLFDSLLGILEEISESLKVIAAAMAPEDDELGTDPESPDHEPE